MRTPTEASASNGPGLRELGDWSKSLRKKRQRLNAESQQPARRAHGARRHRPEATAIEPTVSAVANRAPIGTSFKEWVFKTQPIQGMKKINAFTAKIIAATEMDLVRLFTSAVGKRLTTQDQRWREQCHRNDRAGSHSVRDSSVTTNVKSHSLHRIVRRIRGDRQETLARTLEYLRASSSSSRESSREN
jgi:hypothetical protein